jgi:hypothetical protein
MRNHDHHKHTTAAVCMVPCCHERHARDTAAREENMFGWILYQTASSAGAVAGYNMATHLHLKVIQAVGCGGLGAEQRLHLQAAGSTIGCKTSRRTQWNSMRMLAVDDGCNRPQQFVAVGAQHESRAGGQADHLDACAAASASH